MNKFKFIAEEPFIFDEREVESFGTLKLFDKANGIARHYLIGRRKENCYELCYEFYNETDKRWAIDSGTIFYDKDVAIQIMKHLNKGDKDVN